MKSETLKSYLRRLTDQNLLRPGWLPRLARHRHFVADLVELTGFTERGLVAALPELRTPQAVERWPHLVGHVSKRASTRSACTHCAAAKTHGRTEVVTVFASHEQVICTAHQQWTGSSALRFPVQEQFSVRNCVDVSDAHREHLQLIRRWGRGPCIAASLPPSAVLLSGHTGRPYPEHLVSSVAGNGSISPMTHHQRLPDRSPPGTRAR